MTNLINLIREADKRAACGNRAFKGAVLSLLGDDELSDAIRDIADYEPIKFRKKVRRTVERFEKSI